MVGIKERAPISLSLISILKMIKLLQSKHYSVKELKSRFEISERTIYRYLKIMEEAEYMIEKDFEKRYFIIKN